MTVNSFDHEDSVRAAYDAAERVLGHALDTHEIFIMELPESQRKTLARLAVRIVDAVMHSSEEDIAEIFPDLVERVESERHGRPDPIPESAGLPSA